MIYHIENELRDFTYITNVYKTISAYNLKGHQIGRKIGDMLELLTMGGVYNCPELLPRLDTEGKLEGFTTAGHKVEFGFYDDIAHKAGLFGAIECKCVGVEETTSGKKQAYSLIFNTPAVPQTYSQQRHWTLSQRNLPAFPA